MIIDEYIDRINEAINDGDETKQNALLEEVFRVFEKDIPDIQNGTTFRKRKVLQMRSVRRRSPKSPVK